jgi:hypothetical protein
VFETYRMLGRERELELQREADRLHVLPPSKLWACLRAIPSQMGRVAARVASRTSTKKVGAATEFEEV